MKETQTNSCSIINSNITAYKVAGIGVFGLYALGTNYFTVNNCYIYGGYNCVEFDGTAGSGSSPAGNLTFTNNRLINFSNSALYINNAGYYGASGNTYTNNVIDSCNGSATYGIYSDQETGATYASNKLFAAVYYGFYLTQPNYSSSTQALQIYNCFFTRYLSYGLYFLSGSTDRKSVV